MAQTIIEPKTFKRISCGEPEFQAYASVSIDDLVRIATVLKNAKLPRHIRILVEQFNEEVKKLESNGLDPIR